MTHAAVVSAHEDDEKSPNDSIYNSLLNEGEQQDLETVEDYNEMVAKYENWVAS